MSERNDLSRHAESAANEEFDPELSFAGQDSSAWEVPEAAQAQEAGQEIEPEIEQGIEPESEPQVQDEAQEWVPASETETGQGTDQEEWDAAEAEPEQSGAATEADDSWSAAAEVSAYAQENEVDEVHQLDMSAFAAAYLNQPLLYLDDPALPSWLLISHSGAELYAQPFVAGQASGPRRFLGALPPRTLLPCMAPHPHWRLCLVPSAPDCLDTAVADWEAAGTEPEDQELARHGWQNALHALEPLLWALQEAVPGVTPLAVVDLLSDPHPVHSLNLWLHACLDELRDKRVPLPLAQIEAANLAARQSALIKMATVLDPDLRLHLRPHSQQGQGLASLAASVALAQGLQIGKDANQGESGETLAAWAKRAGLRVRKVALRSLWWQTASLPLLAFYADEEGRPAEAEKLSGPALALLPQRDQTYRWQNEAGEGGVVDAALAERLAPFAWSLHGRLPDRVLQVPDLLSFGWRAASQDVLLLLACALSAGLLGALIPLAVSYVFQTVIPSNELPLLLDFAALIIALSIVSAVLHLCADVAALRIEGRLGNGLQSAVFDRLLRLPLAFYASLTSGDLSNRIATVDVVRRSLAGLSVGLLTSFCYTAGAFAAITYYMPKAALLVLILMLVFWLLAAGIGWKMVKSLYEGEQIEGNIIAMVVQLVQGITKLRLGGAEERAFGLWGRGFAELRTRLGRGKVLFIYLQAVIALLEVAIPASVFALLGYGDGEKPGTAEFLALLAALSTYALSGLSVGQTLCRIVSLKPLFERVRPILQAQPAQQAAGEEIRHLHGGLEVVGLSFAWPGQSQYLLHDISFQIEAGSFVAIVGMSGCGKSSLLRLLLGLEQAQEGSIYYDGRDLRCLNTEHLRRAIGVVLQNGRTMPGSLYDNISVAHPCTVEEAWEAARLAGLDEDIHALPMGMHTVLPEGGAGLSGGQTQRLLLARALAGKPKILMLDEATSALDNRTQAWITSSLAAMAMTRIVIAHRLSTVQKADRIFVLHEGRIAEQGSFEELMKLNGLFTNLANRQLT